MQSWKTNSCVWGCNNGRQRVCEGALAIFQLSLFCFHNITQHYNITTLHYNITQTTLHTGKLFFSSEKSRVGTSATSYIECNNKIGFQNAQYKLIKVTSLFVVWSSEERSIFQREGNLDLKHTLQANSEFFCCSHSKIIWC